MKQTSYANQVSIDIPSSPIEVLKQLLEDTQSTLRTWSQRKSTRRALARLDRHELDDIGITDAERRVETGKWFWEA